MSVKASWSSAKPPAPTTEHESDPFAGIGSDVAVEQRDGLRPTPGAIQRAADPEQTEHPVHLGYWLEDRYTLETPVEEIEARLRTLVEREGNAEAAGVTCPLKGKGDMTCSACPVCEIGQDTKRSALCRIGREQERLVALLHAKRELHRGV